MKLKGEVLALESIGDAVRLTAQSKGARDAEWRPLRRVVIDLTDYEARRFKIGGVVRIEVKP